ncbi:MAG TPA: SPOR domain-containing protein [Rubrivivax sp.]|nr:SPOR domain-containing protein [Rubrivivax sp.]HPO20523.1 SPOR domain-containing protein [Rubrivivax sp.]
MKTRSRSQGGFLVGLIIGLLIGLAAALGVALYVTKVPIPFINKVPNRTADQDAAETQRNKNWDPNAALNGKPPARPPAAASPSPAPPPPALPPPPAAPAATLPGTAPAPATRAAATPPPNGATPSTPAPAGAGGLQFFAQAGAFTRVDDAEAQRAKLALLGLDARITEREQAGRTVYRVRIGPFDARAQADAAIDKLQAAGVDATLVRVQRQ